jgi:hypothetical protein
VEPGQLPRSGRSIGQGWVGVSDPLAPWQRGLAWVGICLGFVSAVVWGVFALRGYRQWQQGERKRPQLALFLGWLVEAMCLLALIGTASSL